MPNNLDFIGLRTQRRRLDNKNLILRHEAASPHLSRQEVSVHSSRWPWESR